MQRDPTWVFTNKKTNYKFVNIKEKHGIDLSAEDVPNAEAKRERKRKRKSSKHLKGLLMAFQALHNIYEYRDLYSLLVYLMSL